MSQKFGFSSVEEFMEQSQKKFSLVETGIVHNPSARLLLINVSRSLKPIEGPKGFTNRATAAYNRGQMMDSCRSKIRCCFSITAAQRKQGEPFFLPLPFLPSLVMFLIFSLQPVYEKRSSNEGRTRKDYIRSRGLIDADTPIFFFRFFPGLLHMGYPISNGTVYPWLESVMGTK